MQIDLQAANSPHYFFCPQQIFKAALLAPSIDNQKHAWQGNAVVIQRALQWFSKAAGGCKVTACNLKAYAILDFCHGPTSPQRICQAQLLSTSGSTCLCRLRYLSQAYKYDSPARFHLGGDRRLTNNRTSREGRDSLLSQRPRSEELCDEVDGVGLWVQPGVEEGHNVLVLELLQDTDLCKEPVPFLF